MNLEFNLKRYTCMMYLHKDLSVLSGVVHIFNVLTHLLNPCLTGFISRCLQCESTEL